MVAMVIGYVVMGVGSVIALIGIAFLGLTCSINYYITGKDAWRIARRVAWELAEERDRADRANAEKARGG